MLFSCSEPRSWSCGLGTMDDILHGLSSLNPSLITAYRDATFSPSDFDLSLEDCWGGVVKAMELGWIELPAST